MRQSARAGSLRNAQTLIDGESDLLFFQKLFDPGGRELAVAAYDSKALGLEFFLQFLQMRHAGDAGRAVDAPVFKKYHFPFQVGSFEFRPVDMAAVVEGWIGDFAFRRLGGGGNRHGGDDTG